jgi:O-antigen/teichoic acid export membrane protein
MSKSSSSFAANVLKLVTGSVFAQGLGVLVAPIVARLFAPEAFGVAALFTSIAGIIGVVACLRYQLAIMLPKTDEEAANLLGVSLFFVLIITGISVLIIFFTGDVIAGMLNSQELKKFLWLVPVSVFVSGIFLALNYWNSRTKQFGRFSIATVISSVVAQTTKLGAGFAGFVSGGTLIGTSILGQIVSTFVLGGQIWRDDHHLFKASIRWKKMIAGLKRHKKFPIYSTWSALLNTASQQLPALLLAFYFSPKIVGFYALGQAVLSMPMGLVGGAVAQVFFQKASEAHNHTGNLSKVVEEVFKRLVSLGIMDFFSIYFFSNQYFVCRT